MAGRPFWSGQLRISLVSFGIQLFPATNSQSNVHFHQIDRKAHQRIRHLNVASNDKPVDNADILKGFEYSKGRYVILEPNESRNFVWKRRRQSASGSSPRRANFLPISSKHPVVGQFENYAVCLRGRPIGRHMVSRTRPAKAYVRALARSTK